MPMMDVSITATLALGLVLGLRHALDADHVAAVATIVGERREDGLRRSLLAGLCWGAGHTLTLGAAGILILALRITIPERLALAFELIVALMLVGLGASALRGALRDRLHVHEHRHDGVRHAHLHFHAARHGDGEEHRHPHPIRSALRPLLVGGLQGLAGSAGPALLVLATAPSLVIGLIYLGVFGAGSILGMAAMSLALGAPLVIAGRRSLGLHRALRAAAGLGSLAVGILLAWDLGVERGLLR
jgi:ABC-type nickel/cobalt efflux system permease component RcnA